MTNKLQLERRIQGRKIAKELLAMAFNETTDDPDIVRGFWSEIADHPEIVRRIEAVMEGPPRPTMTDQQAERFERQKISYGTHVGKTWGQAPIDYLEFVNARNEQLGAYLRSARGKSRFGADPLDSEE